MVLEQERAIPEERPSLVGDAYRALREAIRENVFPPGYQGSEQEIALRLGMSRTPVHEALIRLQADGLVRVLPKRGVVIAALAPEDVREIYDVTIAVEAMAAELIAGMPEPARRRAAAALGASTDAMEAALAADDLAAWAAADAAFHRELVEACGNGRLRRIAGQVDDQAHRARMLTLRLRPRPVRAAAEHRAIVAALLAGDPAGAHASARTHRVRARDALIPLIRELGLRHL
ncbi:HTH-type transcriptional repressor GlaR [Methylobacterium crusticola]|uniref:HTH-type transcriptional repressor GlaR n=1 Tax=Methylobacterium crusticola TaxID=1697972 RepID=A0ABQ4QT28_9HYPH|nr:GntR family transcriptional regulator [Methylobacterium crusticola]GJD48389.1 HTH-type transcriptional repressor GlaR [Methylobacterium crusticola]